MGSSWCNNVILPEHEHICDREKTGQDDLKKREKEIRYRQKCIDMQKKKKIVCYISYWAHDCQGQPSITGCVALNLKFYQVTHIIQMLKLHY